MAPTTTRPPAARVLVHVTVYAVGAVLGICLLLGAWAALAGGSAVRLGEGAGGLGGLPPLVLLAVAALFGLPAAVLAARTRQWRTAALVVVGPVTMALGYFFLAHAVDPCGVGLWDLGSTVGDAPLCEWAAGSTSVDVRFHLLEHAVVTAALFLPWAAALLPGRRRGIRAAVAGGLLWSMYGPLELVEPFGADTRYDDTRAYDVVVEPALFVLYSVPGSAALLLSALGLLTLARRLGTATRLVRGLAAGAAGFAVLSGVGVVAQFDPLFTGPRILGTFVLGFAVLAAAHSAPAGWRAGLRCVGGLAVLLMPVWPLVFALQWLTPAAGAVVLALHGLAWTATGRCTPEQAPPVVPRRGAADAVPVPQLVG